MSEIKKIAPKIVNEGSGVVFLCRLSFVHLDAPYAGKNGENAPKYSVSCIIPKEDTATVKALQEAVKKAYENGVVKAWRGARPNTKSSSFKYPLKDGDVERENDEAYKGSVFFTASSKNPVLTLNRLKEVIPAGDVYSGCWAVCSVNFFAFDQGSKGVAGGLNAVLKYADGERLGGGGGSDASVFDGMGLEPEEDSLNDL